MCVCGGGGVGVGVCMGAHACMHVLSLVVCDELFAVLVSSSELLLSSSTRKDTSTPLVMVNTRSLLKTH